MRYRRAGRLLPVVLMVGVAGCASEPTEKLTLAYQAQDAAVAAEAEEYAPDALNQVLAVRTALDTELAAQAERSAVRRRYGRAEVLADSLYLVAEAARGEAATGREQARTDAEALLVEVRAALAEVTGGLAVAPVGKGSALDLVVLRGDVDGAAQVLNEAQAAFDAGEYRTAITKATAAQDVLARVRQSIDQALPIVRST